MLVSTTEREKSKLFQLLKGTLVAYLLLDYVLNSVVVFFVTSITNQLDNRSQALQDPGLSQYHTGICLYIALALSIVLDIIGLIGVIRENAFFSLLNVCQLSIGILKVVVIYNYIPLIILHMAVVILSLIFAIAVMPDDEHVHLCYP